MHEFGQEQEESSRNRRLRPHSCKQGQGSGTSDHENARYRSKDTVSPPRRPPFTAHTAHGLVPSPPSPTSTSQAMNTQDDSFTLVENRKKKKPSPSQTSSPTDQQPRRAPRPRVGVSLAPRPLSTPRHAVKIMASEDFPNPYDAIVNLQKDSSLAFTARPGRDNSFLVYPENEATMTSISMTKELEGRALKTRPQSKNNKGSGDGLPTELTHQPHRKHGQDHLRYPMHVQWPPHQTVTHKCPNCNGNHHAWNKACPERRRRIQQNMASQAQWVQTHSNAPPGTFVWGTQNNSHLEAPPSTAEFSTLPTQTPIATHDQAPLPSQQQPAQATSPPLVPQEPSITLTASSLKHLLTDFALTLSKILKQDLEQAQLATAVDSLVASHMGTPPQPPTPQAPANTPQEMEEVTAPSPRSPPSSKNANKPSKTTTGQSSSIADHHPSTSQSSSNNTSSLRESVTPTPAAPPTCASCSGTSKGPNANTTSSKKLHKGT
ncbi:hypothetical protein E2C01_057137 [Portunus trituberculatus]|uniref:Uncharacterized protein n=1 Tax=Portunus trituberculatus TaxID=210409 RepID=A0A5B7GZJ9_PORTR|nr:hypothetical protein [Portunus trituberculatus]